MRGVTVISTGVCILYGSSRLHSSSSKWMAVWNSSVSGGSNLPYYSYYVVTKRDSITQKTVFAVTLQKFQKIWNIIVS